ncbi:MAG: hypothetical protein ACYTDW_10925 [Planctomycetota bacterium]|jgi:hypothetical protein
MKTTKPAVILLALVLLIAAGAQSAEKPAKKEISNTRTASCLVKITSDPAVLPLTFETFDYLLRSSGVAGKAAREVLEISPGIVSEIIEIEEVFVGDSSLGGYGGGYGGGMMGGGMMGGGYGGGMDLPADATPGASRYPTTTTSRSTRRTTPTATRTPTRPSTTRTTRPGSIGTTTTTSARRPTKPTPTRPPTRRKPTVTQPLRSVTEQTILFRLLVDFSQSDTAEDIKPAAEEFMMALIDNLRSALHGVFHQYNDKLNKQLELADKEANRAQHELVQMQRELRDISDSRNLSRYVIYQDISNLRQKLQSTTMQRASDEIVYEATAKRIAKTQKKRQERADNDSITSELRSMLYVHEKGLQEAQKLYDAGNASLANIQDLKEKIVRAKIELAQRREQIINPPGGIEISSLNDELANLATKMDLSKKEINILEVQLEAAEGLLKTADQYELLSLKADIARQSLEETLLWRARLGRNIRSIQPPDVTVIGAE